MKLIIPMAGRGTRLRPHTLVTPKPLLKVMGTSIVERLVNDIAELCPEPVDEVAYVVGRFGDDVENELIGVAERLGAKGTIHYQDEALGTAHAIHCAASALKGQVIVAFADTLFRANFKLNTQVDGTIWVKRIEDPSQFGVVVTNEAGEIDGFVEKPKEPVSDLAIIGIYHFKSGENLLAELQYLIDNNVIKGTEYQLTDALENMRLKGEKLFPAEVETWMDCGNKNATVDTNKALLKFKGEDQIADTATLENTTIISPVFIGEHAEIRNSVIGPYTSIGDQTNIDNSIIENSIIGEKTRVNLGLLSNSMIGVQARVSGTFSELSISDYSQVE